MIVWERNAFENLQACESSQTSWFLVGQHGTEGSPEHARGSFVMYEVFLGVSVTSLVDDFTFLEPVSEEGS